jgi:ribonuclease HI
MVYLSRYFGDSVFFILLWKFWAGRNAAVFKGTPLDPSKLAADAMSFTHEFNEASPRQVVRRPEVTPVTQGIPVGVSVFVDTGCGNGGPTGWGLIVRNPEGETVLSMCKRDNYVMDPLTTEALGVRWELQVAIKKGFTSATILSDAANVVNCVNRKSSFAAINFIAQDCRELMKNMLFVCVRFIGRNQNCDAHNLASVAMNVGDRTWLGSFSNCDITS